MKTKQKNSMQKVISCPKQKNHNKKQKKYGLVNVKSKKSITFASHRGKH